MAHAAALRVAEAHAKETADLHLAQLGAELNSPSEPPPELRQAGGAYALSFAVQRLLLLLDVYVESEGEGGGATAIRGTLASRRARGRDRRKPFVYDPKSRQFDSSALSALGRSTVD
jgi:hypothetical protein